MPSKMSGWSKPRAYDAYDAYAEVIMHIQTSSSLVKPQIFPGLSGLYYDNPTFLQKKQSWSKSRYEPSNSWAIQFWSVLIVTPKTKKKPIPPSRTCQDPKAIATKLSPTLQRNRTWSPETGWILGEGWLGRPYGSVSKPCSPGEHQNSWTKNGMYRYWSIAILRETPLLHEEILDDNDWLVVEPYPSEKMLEWKSVGMMTFPIYGKIKHVPNHEPVMILYWLQQAVHQYVLRSWPLGSQRYKVHVQFLEAIREKTAINCHK